MGTASAPSTEIGTRIPTTDSVTRGSSEVLLGGTIPHFITEEYTRKNVFLPDAEYARSLDCLVKGVCDTLLFRTVAGDYNSSKVFLGQRKVQPQPDWWFIGGRIKCGETPSEAAARNVFRETGILAQEKDFVVINVYSFSFGVRQQAPQTNGTCDISIVYALEIGTCMEPKLDAAEYRSGMWFDVNSVAESPRFHPAIRQAVRDYRMRLASFRLHESILTQDADDILARADAMRPWLGVEKAAITDVRFQEDKYKYISGGDVQYEAVFSETKTRIKPKCKDPEVFTPLLGVFVLGIALGFFLRR